MTFRPPHRQPSALSTSTYHTARSNNNHQQQPTPSLSSTTSALRRRESKLQVDDDLPPTTSFDQLIPLSGNKPRPKQCSTKQTNNSHYLCTGVPNEDPLAHYVLIPIGKTGDGKSSLLNALFGYQEFKAAATAKSVTDTVVERTGVWTVDKTNHVVTVADTPGFADSAGRDFTVAIQEYILDVSQRVGIDAFLLVFTLKSQQVMSILKAFSELMKDMEPTNWWDHVILVFTRVDYTTEPQHIVGTKRYITQTLREEIKTTFGLDTPPPAVFVSSKIHTCPLLFGKECDCVEVKFYQNERMRILKETIAKASQHGRWRGGRKQQQQSDQHHVDGSQPHHHSSHSFPPLPLHSYPPPPPPKTHYSQ